MTHETIKASEITVGMMDQADNLITGVEVMGDMVVVFYRESGCEEGHQVTTMPSDMCVSFRRPA
jgi:hypothetical protein